MPESRLKYIVSPKAVKVMKAAKFTNVRLMPITKEENEPSYFKPRSN